jgi:PAS domain S-box-containing protein
LDVTDRKGLIISRQTTTVVVALSLMVVSWMLDAALDSTFEPGTGGFFTQLLHPGYHEIALRLWFLSTLLFFVLYISRSNQRHQAQDVRLKAALRGAETERARSQAILECVGDAISIQDLDMKILYQNQAHIDLMGAHQGEFCHKGYQKRDEVCPGCHLAQSFLDGMTHKTEKSAQTAQGLIFTEIISTPLRDASGHIIAGIEAVRDITDRKRADLAIERMNRELELRALELAEANRELESFSYSLSHDLRSYITRISTAQQILAQTPHAKDPELEYPVQIIEDSCVEMEELIEAILTLSQLSREAMRWEEVSLSEMAHEVALHLQHQELNRKVEFVICEGLQVQGDGHLLRVVLENLLGNSWKYTRGVPAPRIELGVGPHQGGRLFFVRDNGIGFDMAEREKLFRPFQRLQSAQGFSGTGVGLATVERAILRHSGQVWGEGEPGKGTTIYFTLPDQREQVCSTCTGGESQGEGRSHEQR